MEKDMNVELLNAVKNGLQKAICEKLAGYNSPLDEVLKDVVASHTSEIRKLLTEAISGALSEGNFRSEVTDAIRRKLGGLLIQKFGGELEKQVNVLKSDPATRARITLAIEEIVASKG